MSNIIKFPDKESEFEHISYTEGVDDDSIGLAMLDKSIGLARINDSEFAFAMGEDAQVYSREELAEFLWVAAYLLDSEQRHLPKLDLIGCDY
jgi:hypothetical protein